MVMFRFIRDSEVENTVAMSCESCNGFEHGIGCMRDVCHKDVPFRTNDPDIPDGRCKSVENGGV